jgi:hypothetical protein
MGWNTFHTYIGFSIENKMADLNTCTYLGFSIKNRIRMSEGYQQRKAHLRLINLKRTLFDLAGTKDSSWTDRICFWQNMKIFAEIEFRQKQIIPFSCSSYFVSESYLTHNTYIFFWLSYWLGNIDSSPKLFVRFLFPPNQKVCVLD